MPKFKPYPVKLKERPSWWKVRLPEIREELSKVKKGRVEMILRSKKIAAVHYQEKEFPPPLNCWPTAANSADPNAFKTSGYDPQCVMIIAGIHGAEPEGVVAVLNLIHLLETGRDLRGESRPKLLRLLQRYRLVLVPCCNPDGRSISPDHMEGLSLDEFRRISQGVWKDGRTIGWAQSKLYFPLPLDQVSFPGGYPNRDGYNIGPDCAPGRLYTAEARALYSLILRSQPDLFLNLHSQEKKCSFGGPSTFNYIGNIRRGKRLAGKVYRAFLKAGIPVEKPFFKSQTIGTNTAAVMLTGTQALTYESTTCLCSFDQRLEAHYILLETLLAAGQKELFAPRDNLR